MPYFLSVALAVFLYLHVQKFTYGLMDILDDFTARSVESTVVVFSLRATPFRLKYLVMHWHITVRE